MGIFNDFFGGFFKRPSARSGTGIADELHVMGRQQKDSLDDVIDHELPSVNRRTRGNKFGTMLGYLVIFGGGAAMLYSILAPVKKVDQPPQKMHITNNMPKIEAPVLPPPLPPPPITVPNIDAQANPIPVANAGQKLPRQPDWTDRKMGGSSMTSVAGTGGVISSNGSGEPARAAEKSPAESTWLAVKLKPIATPDSYAQMLADRDYLITKGTSLDCALETAIDSTLSGMTTCRLTRDIYSDNGHVVLLDRGSQLVGEYQGGLAQGQARIFILWTRAKTPNGVIIPLDSPGTDALGRTGHAGFVDRHFFERFGAAVIYSLVRDSLLIAQKNNNTSINIGGNGTDAVALEMLKSTVNIPPTLNINQGEHIQIMVARDLDFSTVYGLDLKE